MSSVNRHGLIDTMAISVGSLFFPGYFGKKVDSVPIEEHLNGIQLQIPPIEEEKTYELTAQTLVGDLNPALRLAQWKGPSYPTVIYHHGAMEIPFDYGFRNIFPFEKMTIIANLFLIRAPYHARRKDFLGGMVATENWLAMKAVSIRVIEEAIQQVRLKSKESILVGGTSLGGFITNLHHIHFNSADVYTPILAGLSMYDAFLNSVYSKSVSTFAKENPQIMKRLFDFQPSFDACSYSHDNVIDKGHTTGALSYELLRNHMLKHLSGELA